MEGDQGLHSIGVVERDTGIGRDTLRVWERRYGFPSPMRNDKGERIYSEQQLRRLQRIRRLMDQGLRPGKLLPLGDAGLDELELSLKGNGDSGPDLKIKPLFDAVKTLDGDELQYQLGKQYDHLGMTAFITEIVTPLLKLVGNAWARGDLQIFQEHYLSQQLIHFLNVKIATLQGKEIRPRILLATLPGEEHSLGLLMLSALLCAKGVTCINLGAQVPMDQIHQAVQHHKITVVALTFSAAYQYSSIRSHLLELKDLLGDEVDVWTGGEGVRRLRKLPSGVTKFTSLEHLPISA